VNPAKTHSVVFLAGSSHPAKTTSFLVDCSAALWENECVKTQQRKDLEMSTYTVVNGEVVGDVRAWLAATLAECGRGANARRRELPPQSYKERRAIYRREEVEAHERLPGGR
jgi:hypothetical protein